MKTGYSNNSTKTQIALLAGNTTTIEKKLLVSFLWSAVGCRTPDELPTSETATNMNRIKTTMQNLFIVSLFRLIDISKNLGCYPVANVAFRLLLWLNFKAKKPLLVAEVETESCEIGEGTEWYYPQIDGQGYYIDQIDYYYDLLVLRYNAEYACIPMPLVADDPTNELWYALEHCTFKDKQEHSRITVWQTLAYRLSGTMTRKRSGGRSSQYKSYYNPLQFVWLWLQGWRVSK